VAAWSQKDSAPVRAESTMQRLRTLMDLYDWGNWPDFFPVEFIDVADQEMSPVIDAAD